MCTTVLNKEGMTFGTYVSMQTIECYKCAIPFAVPAEYKSRLQAKGEDFYCPNGHRQHYCKSTEQVLREKLEKQKRDYEERIEGLEGTIYWKDQKIKETKGKLTGQKIQNTKMKNRIKNGVCPCCNRTFENLAAHMKTKHPDYTQK